MTEPKPPFTIDWRVGFGLTVTILWFSAGLSYLLGIVGADNFIHLPTADIGSFLEGAFAPLAFLWLVIGHFMQQKEISSNTRAIKLQEHSARRLELHSRQDSYFKLLSLVQDQLGAIAGLGRCGGGGAAMAGTAPLTGAGWAAGCHAGVSAGPGNWAPAPGTEPGPNALGPPVGDGPGSGRPTSSAGGW